jgi:hypothetical protein
MAWLESEDMDMELCVWITLCFESSSMGSTDYRYSLKHIANRFYHLILMH